MRLIVVFCILLLCGCSFVGSKTFSTQDSGPDTDVDVSHVKDAVPRYERITKAGNYSPYTVLGKTYRVNFDTEGFSQHGKASWYGRKFHGNKTANGEKYDMYAMTAAHKTLPIPSYVRVTNLKNQRSVVVRVNDRGPFHAGRVIDLSYAAAKKLGIQQAGTGDVRVDIVSPEVPVNGPSKAVSGTHTKKSYLQIGAFRDPSSASRLKAKVKTLTPQNVFVAPISGNGIHRVMVGPIQSQQILIQVKKKLSQAELSDTLVVRF